MWSRLDVVKHSVLVYRAGDMQHTHTHRSTHQKGAAHVCPLAHLSQASFGRNVEGALEFFVEARGNFSNLDAVLKYEVHRVNALIMQTHALVKGNHNRKTAQFVRSCIAFTFITIPSISDFVMRHKLYVASGAVAVTNHALSQADVFFQAAIDLIPELPERIDVRCSSTSASTRAHNSRCVVGGSRGGRGCGGEKRNSHVCGEI